MIYSIYRKHLKEIPWAGFAEQNLRSHFAIKPKAPCLNSRKPTPRPNKSSQKSYIQTLLRSSPNIKIGPGSKSNQSTLETWRATWERPNNILSTPTSLITTLCWVAISSVEESNGWGSLTSLITLSTRDNKTGPSWKILESIAQLCKRPWCLSQEQVLQFTKKFYLKLSTEKESMSSSTFEFKLGFSGMDTSRILLSTTISLLTMEVLSSWGQSGKIKFIQCCCKRPSQKPAGAMKAFLTMLKKSYKWSFADQSIQTSLLSSDSRISLVTKLDMAFRTSSSLFWWVGETPKFGTMDSTTTKFMLWYF